METKKRIVISGYYGFDNTGDEAVLYSIIQAIRCECKGNQFEIVVLSNNAKKTSMLYGVNAVNRWDLKVVAKEVKTCHMLISGGGSLLQDVTSSKTIPYYLLIIKIALWYKKKVVFYSQGIGPVNHWYSQLLIKTIVNKVDYIFVRDRKSKKSLRNMGVRKPPIEVSADPVLGMKVDKDIQSNIKALIEGYSSEEIKRVGIYLRSWKNDDLLLEKIRVLCNALYKKGLEIFFIPMHQPEDKDFIEKMPSLDIPIHIITQYLNAQEMFALTGEMDIVISVRLHALIMATAQGIPTIGLSYDPKIDAFMDGIDNKNCFDIDTFSPEEVANCVFSQLESNKNQDKSIQCTNGLIEKAYKPAKLIAKMLGY